MNLRFVYTFSKLYGYKAIRRNIPYIISALMMPLSLLFIFYMVSKSTLFPFAILGGMVSILMTNGLNTLFDSAQMRITYKAQDLFIATGLTPASYMLGMMANELVFASPSIVVYLAIGIFFHVYTLHSILPIAIIYLLLYLAVSSIAFLVSGVPSKMRGVWGYTNILLILLSLIPPVYYPYTYLPKPLLYLMMAVPTTSASMLISGISGLAPFFPMALPVFIIEVVICVYLSVRFCRWRSK